MANGYPLINIYETGQKIKQEMNVNGLTAKDIQRFLNLSSVQSIYHWFEGKSLPSIDNLYALSSLFHVPMDSLVCGSRKEYMSFDDSIRDRLIVYYKRIILFEYK